MLIQLSKPHLLLVCLLINLSCCTDTNSTNGTTNSTSSRAELKMMISDIVDFYQNNQKPMLGQLEMSVNKTSAADAMDMLVVQVGKVNNGHPNVTYSLQFLASSQQSQQQQQGQGQQQLFSLQGQTYSNQTDNYYQLVFRNLTVDSIRQNCAEQENEGEYKCSGIITYQDRHYISDFASAISNTTNTNTNTNSSNSNSSSVGSLSTSVIISVLKVIDLSIQLDSSLSTISNLTATARPSEVKCLDTSCQGTSGLGVSTETCVEDNQLLLKDTAGTTSQVNDISYDLVQGKQSGLRATVQDTTYLLGQDFVKVLYQARMQMQLTLPEGILDQGSAVVVTPKFLKF